MKCQHEPPPIFEASQNTTRLHQWTITPGDRYKRINGRTELGLLVYVSDQSKILLKGMKGG